MYRALAIMVFLAAPAMAQIQLDDFVSNFESANIDAIGQIGVDSFTFEIRLDDLTGDTYGWYYFAIAGNSGRVATLYLTNPDGWQNESCKPLFSLDNRNWYRVNSVWRQGGWVGFRQYLAAETVWFAQDFPYTVSGIYGYFDTLAASPYITRRTLGHSVLGRPIDMIELTDHDWPGYKKKNVWLISRQHPMESPATFLLYAFIERLLSNDQFARRFLRDISLCVVPVVNVDGVVGGYSRHNVNGLNLNRVWDPDFQSEEPEVRAVHMAIDSFITSGNSIDFFMDLHAAPDNYDFGFRMSQSYTGENYFRNQETFLHLLETYDAYQDRSRWRDLDTNYAFGVSCVVLYDMYGLDAFSSELPWTRRDDGNFITIETILNQGPAWAQAIYDNLYPLTAIDAADTIIDFIDTGNSFRPGIWDFDQRSQNSLSISAICAESADSELFVLERQNSDGLFRSVNLIATNSGPSVTGDGIVSLSEGGEMVLTYLDPLIPSRVFRRYLPVGPPCSYMPGDVNNNGNSNGVDVIYLVSYLKGGALPPVQCECAEHGALFVAADVNGDCAANGIDVIYLVNYFKGGAALQYCADCPPGDW